MYYYHLISNNGFGDHYYCIAWNMTAARDLCGLNPKSESKAVGYRISKKEYDSVRSNFTKGIHKF